MLYIKEYIRRITFRSILRNIPFLISILSAGFLLFTSMYNFPAFITYMIVMLAATVLFQFDPQVVKRNITSNLLLTAAVMSCFLSSSFYTIALESHRIHSLVALAQKVLPFSFQQTVLLGTLLGGALSVYSLLYLLCAAIEKFDLKSVLLDLKARLLSYPHIWRSYFTLCVLNLIAISALLRANVDFQDDVQRIVDGIPGFGLFSRHLMGFLIKVVNTGTYLVDLSPLTQILAVLIVSAAGMILILTFSGKNTISLWSIIAVLPLSLSPYFLECLSFKFDSPYMALTIFLSVFPLLFYRCKPGLYMTVTTLCILMTSSIYQAGLGIFPSTIVLLAFVTWHRGGDLKKTMQLIAYSVIGYLAGMLLYRIFIMKPVSDYVSSEMFPLRELPGGVISNLKQYFQYVLNDFDAKWLASIAFLLVCFVLLHACEAKQKKWLTVLLAASALVLAMCLSFGLYIALTMPSFACRAMYGFGVCIAIIAIVCVDFEKAAIAKLSALYLSWCLVVFSVMYGNALEEQVRYQDFRLEMVLQELNDIPEFDPEENTNIQITGTIGISPIIRSMPQFSGALERIITTTFLTWTDHVFYHYYDLQNVTTVRNLDKESLPVLHDGYYETIYGDENNILIELKEY